MTVRERQFNASFQNKRKLALAVNAQHGRWMLFPKPVRSPALGEFSVGRQNEAGSDRERPEVPELLDLVFAVDSVPAVFAITQDPFIVYTSNIFAVLGLRALYFSLADLTARFRYLHYALAAVLVFVGGKILATDLIGTMPAWASLSVTVGLLASGILYSCHHSRMLPSGPRQTGLRHS